MQRQEKQRALEIFDEATIFCDQLRSFWQSEKGQLGGGRFETNNEAAWAVAMTYNNLGILHKQMKRADQAIKNLKKVVEIEEKMTNSESRAMELA